MTSSKCSCNSEASASELQEHFEEVFHQYYIDYDGISEFKSSTTHWCVTRRESGYLAKHEEVTPLINHGLTNTILSCR